MTIGEMIRMAAVPQFYQVVITLHSTPGPVGIEAAAQVMAAIPYALF
jgi:hypothetical protein